MGLATLLSVLLLIFQFGARSLPSTVTIVHLSMRWSQTLQKFCAGLHVHVGRVADA